MMMMKKKYPVWIAALTVKLRLWSSSVQSQMVQRGSNVLVVIVSSSVTHKIINSSNEPRAGSYQNITDIGRRIREESVRMSERLLRLATFS
jgi:hypothetical protein